MLFSLLLSKDRAKARNGFTLIELLVVIAIIGLLSSVVLASLSGARESARDSVRFQDFDQMQTALELYFNEKGQYPCGDAGIIETQNGQQFTIDTSQSDGFISGAESNDSSCPSGSLEGLDDIGAYSARTREDPVNDPESFYYTYQVKFNRASYLLYVPLENSDRAANDGGLCDNWYEAGTGVGEIPIIEDPTYHDIPVSCN